MNSPNTSSEVEKEIEDILNNDCCFLVCDKCYGGGHDYEKSNDCSECGGTGLTEGRNDYAVNKIKELLHQSEIKGRINELSSALRKCTTRMGRAELERRLKSLNQMKGKDK